MDDTPHRIEPLRRTDWPTVRAIYEEGLATGDATFRAAAEAGIWTLQASVFPENEATLRLHARAGFRVVGRRERIACLHGRWRDTLLLERRLTVAHPGGPPEG